MSHRSGCDPVRSAAGVAKTLVQRGEKRLHVVEGAGFAHQTDPPNLPFERAKARANLDVEVREQFLPHASFIHCLRHAYRV